MKSSLQPSLYFFSQQQSSSTSAQSQSPYLKAILSGRLVAAKSERYIETLNPDRAAASRYIKESKQSNKY